jgi:hypothetical protein
MLPPMPCSSPDYSRDRKAVRDLCEAIYAYLTLPYDRQEQLFNQQLKPRANVGDMAQLSDRIEDLREQIEENRQKCRLAVDSAPEEVRGMAALQMDALLIDPLERELGQMEKWLSQMQAELEKGTSVIAPAEGG